MGKIPVTEGQKKEIAQKWLEAGKFDTADDVTGWWIEETAANRVVQQVLGGRRKRGIGKQLAAEWDLVAADGFGDFCLHEEALRELAGPEEGHVPAAKKAARGGKKAPDERIR